MRFAVIGDSSSVAGLLEVIVRRPEHELAAFVLAPGLHASMRPLVPSAKLCRSWEELLADVSLTAIIVAGEDEETLQGARQLAAAGKALVVDAVAGRSATLAYELTLVQAEQPIHLVPLFVRRAHPLVARLRSILASGRMGAVRHMLLERRLAPSEALANSAGLSSRDLAQAFLPDADLVRSVWGEYDTVTAVRTGDATSGISLATITLSGSALPQVIWSAALAGAEPQWRLHVVAAEGTITLSGSPDGRTMQLETAAAGGASETETVTFDGNDWLLSEFSNLPAASKPSVSPAEITEAAGTSCPDWNDFTRAVELFEAAERSIRRRRTIEIHFEPPSERGQFKTQMTAAGCSLLVLTLTATIVYLTVNSVVTLPAKLKPILVALIFLPLGLFLALQGLLFLARPSGDAAKPKRSVP